LLPSWKITPDRSLNSQVVSPTVFQLSASHGKSFVFGSRLVSRSKMCVATVLLGAALKKCGSIEVAGAARPMRSSAAWAAEMQVKTANAVAQWRIIPGFPFGMAWIGSRRSNWIGIVRLVAPAQ
jgi:hypothetical protein